MPCFYLGTVQTSISSQISDLAIYEGMVFINNHLSVTEWSLTTFSIFSVIFCKVSVLDNVKQRNGLGRGSPCSQLKVYIDFNDTVVEIGKHKRGEGYLKLVAKVHYL